MTVFAEFLVTALFGLGASAAVIALFRFLLPRMNDRHSDTPASATSSPWADRAFLVLAVEYTFVLVALTVLRYYAFSTSTTDLAQYDQLIWNSLHGRLLENSYIPDAPQFLGKSFSPILLALVPLYALWPSPIVLLIVQTLAMSAAAFPIYWFARERLGSTLALVVGAAYFLFPAIWYVNLDEFHEISLAVPLLAFTTFFLLRRKYKHFLVCLVVSLLVKEEIALIAIGFGAFIFLFQRKRALGLGISLAATAFAIALLLFITPFFRGAPAGDFYYFGEGTFAGRGVRYAYLGHSLSEIVATVVTRPDIVLPHVLIPDKIEYVLHLLVPLAFLPLFGMDVALLALPTLSYTLLSDYIWQYDIRTTYPAPLIPFMFFSAIVGLERILARRRSLPFLGKRLNALPSNACTSAAAALILVSSGLSFFLQGPGPWARDFRAQDYAVAPDALEQEAWLRSIPSDAVVVAQNEFLAHVSNRQVVHEIPAIADYRQADYVVADRSRAWYAIHGAYWNAFLASGYFEPLVQRGGFVMAKRRVPENTLQITFAGQIRLLGCTIPLTQTLRGGMTVRPILSWQAIQEIPERYFVALQVEDATGHVWAKENVEPQDGLAPTNGWPVGKSLIDQYTLTLPPGMPSGEYQITVGLRGLDAADNLLVLDENGKPLGSEAVVVTLHVE